MSRNRGAGIVNARPWPKITSSEKKKLVQWARDNWSPGQEVNKQWHPIIQWHWRKMDRMKRG